MSISEYEQFQKDNPHMESQPTSPQIISGVSSMKPDNGFRELLKDIKKKNPGSRVNDFGGPTNV